MCIGSTAASRSVVSTATNVVRHYRSTLALQSVGKAQRGIRRALYSIPRKPFVQLPLEPRGCSPCYIGYPYAGSGLSLAVKLVILNPQASGSPQTAVEDVRRCPSQIATTNLGGLRVSEGNGVNLSPCFQILAPKLVTRRPQVVGSLLTRQPSRTGEQYLQFRHVAYYLLQKSEYSRLRPWGYQPMVHHQFFYGRLSPERMTRKDLLLTTQYPAAGHPTRWITL